MESLSLKKKMNIHRLVHSQKMPVDQTMVPNLLTVLRKPNSADGGMLSATPVVFAREAIGGRIEELVHPLYILRTGVF